MLVTQVAAATGALGWMFLSGCAVVRLHYLGACSGAVAGPSCYYTQHQVLLRLKRL
jgi:ammonia channel protein AmtB